MSSSSTPKSDISLAVGDPRGLDLERMNIQQAIGVAATEAAIENGTLMPFFRVPCCISRPSSNLTLQIRERRAFVVERAVDERAEARRVHRHLPVVDGESMTRESSKIGTCPALNGPHASVQPGDRPGPHRPPRADGRCACRCRRLAGGGTRREQSCAARCRRGRGPASGPVLATLMPPGAPGKTGRTLQPGYASVGRLRQLPQNEALQVVRLGST